MDATDHFPFLFPRRPGTHLLTCKSRLPSNAVQCAFAMLLAAALPFSGLAQENDPKARSTQIAAEAVVPQLEAWVSEIEAHQASLEELYGNIGAMEKTLGAAFDEQGVVWARRYIDSWVGGGGLLHYNNDGKRLYRTHLKALRDSADFISSQGHANPEDLAYLAHGMAVYRQAHRELADILASRVSAMARRARFLDAAHVAILDSPEHRDARHRAEEDNEKPGHVETSRRVEELGRIAFEALGGGSPRWNGTYFSSIDHNSGITRLVVNNEDGSRTIMEIDPEGQVTMERDPLALDSEELVSVTTDPATGETTAVRRHADGNTTTSTGRWDTDDEGNERFIETDERGTQRETIVTPDGTVAVTRIDPDGSRSTVTMHPDGDIEHLAHEPGGGTTTTHRNAWTDTITTERRDAEGDLIETLVQRPDGWTQRIDPAGNLQAVHVDETGRRTVIELDAQGNTTTSVIDADGNLVGRERVRATAMEPGRAYYEDEVDGTEWDALPESHKTQYRQSEQSRQREAELRRFREQQAREQQLRKEAEQALVQEQLDRSQEEWDRLVAEELAEKLEYQQLQEERRLAEERQMVVAKLRREMRELDEQIQAAAARGDRQETLRLENHSDKLHHELTELSELLIPTEQQQAQMQRREAVRAELMNEIARGARLDASIEIYDQARLQDTRDSLMGSTGMRLIFGTSEYERQTSPLVRRHDRERAWGRARREQIDRMLGSGDYSEEQQEILREARQRAENQEQYAQQWLTSNSRIRTGGYVTEVATSLIPTGWLGRAIGAPARGATSTTARRVAGEAAGEVAEQNVSRLVKGLRWDVGEGVTSAADRAARFVVGDAAVDTTTRVARTNVSDLTRRAIGREPADAAVAAGAPRVVRLAPEETREALSRSLPLSPADAGDAAAVWRYRPPEQRIGSAIDNAPLRDPGARTERIQRVSEMSPAQQKAYQDRMAAAQVDRAFRQADSMPSITQIDGSDMLDPPAIVRSAMPAGQPTFGVAEVQRLFEPGITLTGPEIVRKAELMIMRERARNLAERAPDAHRTALQDWYRRIDHAAQGEIPTIMMRHVPASGPVPRGATPPRDFANMSSVLDRPPPFMRPPAGGRTHELTLVDFPPLVDSRLLPAPAPLRPGAQPAGPTTLWPSGLVVHGQPGPGVRLDHLEAAQRIANQAGTPVVVSGARQTGNTPAGAVAPGQDLGFGAVGSGPAANLVRHALKGTSPSVSFNAAKEQFNSIDEAIEEGNVVVSPAQ